MKLNIHRDKKNVFQSQIIGKYERPDTTTEETVMKLFQTEFTNDEISNIVEALYDKNTAKGLFQTSQIILLRTSKNLNKENYALVMQ